MPTVKVEQRLKRSAYFQLKHEQMLLINADSKTLKTSLISLTYWGITISCDGCELGAPGIKSKASLVPCRTIGFPYFHDDISWPTK